MGVTYSQQLCFIRQLQIIQFHLQSLEGGSARVIKSLIKPQQFDIISQIERQDPRRKKLSKTSVVAIPAHLIFFDGGYQLLLLAHLNMCLCFMEKLLISNFNMYPHIYGFFRLRLGTPYQKLLPNNREMIKPTKVPLSTYWCLKYNPQEKSHIIILSYSKYKGPKAFGMHNAQLQGRISRK